MTDTPTLTGVDIGEAQRAVGAVLDSVLAETGTPFVTWVALNILATAPPATRDELVTRMVAGLKRDRASVDSTLASAEAAGLLRTEPGVELTNAPLRERFSRITLGGIARHDLEMLDG